MEGGFVLQLCYSRSKPGKCLIPEGVNNFNFVVISVSDKDHILLRYKVYTHGVLQLGFSPDTIQVSVGM
jgi:hypothetical protein